MTNPKKSGKNGMDRRRFLKTSALGTAALAGALQQGLSAPNSLQQDLSAPNILKKRPPNVLLILTDQQGPDTISGLGTAHVRTPGMDHLVERGTSFVQSYCSNPQCSPARSSLLTGRATLETGVLTNNRAIIDTLPNLGQWLGQNGYESFYVGKWHLAKGYTDRIPGFRVLPGGLMVKGELGDGAVSRTCQGFLQNRKGDTPFFLMASFLQPHDICQFTTMHQAGIEALPYPDLAERLPSLPANHEATPPEPRTMKKHRRPAWSPLTWQYYLYTYLRMVERVDAEVQRVVQALEDSGHGEDTLVIFTSDHGDGAACHNMVGKGFLYDEAVKVPLVISCPGRVAEKVRDDTHLVTGLDMVPTICDFAGVETPPNQRGMSLKPLLQGESPAWREFVAAEALGTGRMIRTDRYKYVTVRGDPVEQLFDMKEDPGETQNLAGDSRFDTLLEDHRKLDAKWERGLKFAPGVRAQLRRMERSSKNK